MARPDGGQSLEIPNMTESNPSSSFLENLARPQPDPGGGAAAAYTALLALALLEKVSRLELSRHPSGDDRYALWQDQLKVVGGLRVEFARLCRDDVRAYQRLATSITSGEKDPKQRHGAVLGAIDCPHEMIRMVHPALEVGAGVGRFCRKHLVGDVLVSIELLGAALQGAYHIASANLPLLTDVCERQSVGVKLARSRDFGLDLLASIRANLTGRLH
jgi:methenyltetrahydrofolate cyclohydrolase